jgi:hypothetical protein
MFDSSLIRFKLKGALIHLALSAIIALSLAYLIYEIWYPYPYRNLMGGGFLFKLLIVVDVISGPLLTLVVLNPKKRKKELFLDVLTISIFQFAALAYGVYSVAVARPVVVAFEADRFVVVSAAQIDPEDLKLAEPPLQSFSWTGPTWVGTRSPKDAQETLASIELSLRGAEPSVRPDWWQDLSKSQPDVVKRMKPVVDLHANSPEESRKAINLAVQETGATIESLHYLPMVSKYSLNEWVVLLDGRGGVQGYAPVGGF